jgi:hypothetical protein
VGLQFFGSFLAGGLGALGSLGRRGQSSINSSELAGSMTLEKRDKNDYDN